MHAGRNDDLIGVPVPVDGLDEEALIVARQPSHPYAGPDRQLVVDGVPLQVVGHLVAGGTVPRARSAARAGSRTAAG